MLNSEKIRLMTRLTVYEEGLGVKDGRTAEYFRNDYILFGLVGSFVAGSLAWGVCAAVYCGYFFENIFFSVYENSLGTYLRLAVTSYAVFILIFLLVTLLVFYRRSAAFARRRGMYQQDLEALTEICDREIGIKEKDVGSHLVIQACGKKSFTVEIAFFVIQCLIGEAHIVDWKI